MRRHLLLLSGLTLLGGAHVAAATGCADDVAQTASRYDLKIAQTDTGTRGGEAPAANSGTSAPSTQESRGLGASDTLAPSGGVVAPPATADRGMAIEPPQTGPSATPTLPSVPPQSAQGGGTAGAAPPPQADAQQLSAATRSQAEALLQAARAADAQGKSEECFLRLREAQALITGKGS